MPKTFRELNNNYDLTFYGDDKFLSSVWYSEQEVQELKDKIKKLSGIEGLEFWKKQAKYLQKELNISDEFRKKLQKENEELRERMDTHQNAQLGK